MEGDAEKAAALPPRPPRGSRRSSGAAGPQRRRSSAAGHPRRRRSSAAGRPRQRSAPPTPAAAEQPSPPPPSPGAYKSYSGRRPSPPPEEQAGAELAEGDEVEAHFDGQWRRGRVESTEGPGDWVLVKLEGLPAGAYRKLRKQVRDEDEEAEEAAAAAPSPALPSPRGPRKGNDRADKAGISPRLFYGRGIKGRGRRRRRVRPPDDGTSSESDSGAPFQTLPLWWPLADEDDEDAATDFYSFEDLLRVSWQRWARDVAEWSAVAAAVAAAAAASAPRKQCGRLQRMPASFRALSRTSSRQLVAQQTYSTLALSARRPQKPHPIRASVSRPAAAAATSDAVAAAPWERCSGVEQLRRGVRRVAAEVMEEPVRARRRRRQMREAELQKLAVERGIRREARDVRVRGARKLFNAWQQCADGHSERRRHTAHAARTAELEEEACMRLHSACSAPNTLADVPTSESRMRGAVESLWAVQARAAAAAAECQRQLIRAGHLQDTLSRVHARERQLCGDEREAKAKRRYTRLLRRVLRARRRYAETQSVLRRLRGLRDAARRAARQRHGAARDPHRSWVEAARFRCLELIDHVRQKRGCVGGGSDGSAKQLLRALPQVLSAAEGELEEMRRCVLHRSWPGVASDSGAASALLQEVAGVHDGASTDADDRLPSGSDTDGSSPTDSDYNSGDRAAASMPKPAAELHTRAASAVVCAGLTPTLTDALRAKFVEELRTMRRLHRRCLAGDVSGETCSDGTDDDSLSVVSSEPSSLGSQQGYAHGALASLRADRVQYRRQHAAECAAVAAAAVLAAVSTADEQAAAEEEETPEDGSRVNTPAALPDVGTPRGRMRVQISRQPAEIVAAAASAASEPRSPQDRDAVPVSTREVAPWRGPRSPQGQLWPLSLRGLGVPVVAGATQTRAGTPPEQQQHQQQQHQQQQQQPQKSSASARKVRILPGYAGPRPPQKRQGFARRPNPTRVRTSGVLPVLRQQ